MQICYNGVWGSVTSPAWGFREAQVVCRELQFQEFGNFLYLATNSEACLLDEGH